MDIATILFTYNRSKHTRMVLNALAENRVLPQKLFIFQDGMRASTDKTEWERVSEEISSVSWCDTEVIIDEKNKGLANSVKSGVSKVLQTYDAVIVLEDDCIPHPQFMEYMIKALERYENCKKVYHIGACSEPVDINGDGTDAYFLGRINSWGWGTWKDRWEQFDNDYTMLGKIKSNAKLNEWFTLWGQDLESHVLGNVLGKTDSWAVFWALTVIMKKGYCMSPYESMITNIGLDGTGVHCGLRESGLKIRSKEKLTDIHLPDKVELVKDYKRIFANYHIWTSAEVRNEYYKNVALNLLELQKKNRNIAEYLKGLNIQNVIIWGTGRLCDYLIGELDHKVKIDAIVETYPQKRKYKEMKVISWKVIPSSVPLIILIPGYDIIRIENMLRNAGQKNNIISIDRLINKILF